MVKLQAIFVKLFLSWPQILAENYSARLFQEYEQK